MPPDWGECLWTPSRSRIRNSNLLRFLTWLKGERGLDFSGYDELWNWSVSDLEGFWSAIWDHFGVEAEKRYDQVISDRQMPGAVWFEGARLNFSQNVLRHERHMPDEAAIIAVSEDVPTREVSWSELGDSVRTLATALRNLGIQPGDRIISYLPNTVEAIVALLATTAVGGIFASASPEFGAKTVIDRFGQLDPKLIFVAPSYRFNGADRDKSESIGAVVNAIPSLEHVVYVSSGHQLGSSFPGTESHSWDSLMESGRALSSGPFEFEQVGHDHPLWILFSSGTTGLPKAIVQSHVGILLEHLKAQHFTAELTHGSRIFFYTTTSWMVWNSLVCTLLTGCSIVIYDGSPVYPDASALWQITESTGATVLGCSPGLVQKMAAVQMTPAANFDLAKLEMIVLGGAPSTPETFSWLYENVKKDLWVTSQTGGTDLCSTIAGGISLAPVYAGEIQGAALGIHVDCLSPSGQSLRNETGELVIRSPSPSMPLGFWKDQDDARYRESYFSTYPGVWQQGDLCLINDRGGLYVFGRSDATLNRHGVRIGTAEIYRTLDSISEIEDGLVVCVSDETILFVQMPAGKALTNELGDEIRKRLKLENSPRHVPDKIVQAPAIPYTLTGKRLEVPVRRLLEGSPIEQVADPQMLRDAAALEWFETFSAVAV
ncbi:acetoacetyl-CoA synthetase [Hyphomonas adhaerens MHS-3]|uniref:Acetoacetyl-CoA synthetase n=2 Tax=Hyphomonas adhaerens TaxID=81029 RepID=A0A069E774_9PROT|nr:acetoacetyl-CoA synthetase [Hyphomonas adhaerens MHS-3]